MRKYGVRPAALSVVLLLTVSGCGVAEFYGEVLVHAPDLFKPVGEQDTRNLGPEPTSYMQVVQAYMSPRLIAQTSALYDDWVGPYRAPLHGENAVDGYIVEVTITDRDASGNYTEPKRHEFMLRNDNVVLHGEVLRCCGVVWRPS